MGDLLQRSVGPGVRIDAQFPLQMPRAQVDANQLELALLNLVVNARDAMPDGGMITITARQRSVSGVSADGLAPGDYVGIAVTDTGSGMDEATLVRAREPFFTTKGIGKGTGLGVSMVHGLAQQSGGKLSLTSERGRGTTAEIWLPAVVGEAEQPHGSVPSIEPEKPSAPALRPLTVLAVDDDPLVLSSTAEMLEDLGHTVIQAASGREALDVLRSNPMVDLLLTDHAMPGMTGMQLAVAVRVERPNLPIILASGYAELAGDASVALPRLRKPFDQAAVQAAIEGQIEQQGATVLPFPARHG